MFFLELISQIKGKIIYPELGNILYLDTLGKSRCHRHWKPKKYHYLHSSLFGTLSSRPKPLPGPAPGYSMRWVLYEVSLWAAQTLLCVTDLEHWWRKTFEMKTSFEQKLKIHEFQPFLILLNISTYVSHETYTVLDMSSGFPSIKCSCSLPWFWTEQLARFRRSVRCNTHQICQLQPVSALFHDWLHMWFYQLISALFYPSVLSAISPDIFFFLLWLLFMSHCWLFMYKNEG